MMATTTLSVTLSVRPLNSQELLKQVPVLATVASHLVLHSDLVDLASVAAVVFHRARLLDQPVVFHLALLSALRALALATAVVFHLVLHLDQAAAAEAEEQHPKSGSLHPPGHRVHQAALLSDSGSGCFQAGAA